MAQPKITAHTEVTNKWYANTYLWTTLALLLTLGYATYSIWSTSEEVHETEASAISAEEARVAAVAAQNEAETNLDNARDAISSLEGDVLSLKADTTELNVRLDSMQIVLDSIALAERVVVPVDSIPLIPVDSLGKNKGDYEIDDIIFFGIVTQKIRLDAFKKMVLKDTFALRAPEEMDFNAKEAGITTNEKSFSSKIASGEAYQFFFEEGGAEEHPELFEAFKKGASHQITCIDWFERTLGLKNGDYISELTAGMDLGKIQETFGFPDKNATEKQIERAKILDGMSEEGRKIYRIFLEKLQSQ